MKSIHAHQNGLTKPASIALLALVGLIGSSEVSWGAFAGYSTGIFVEPTGPGVPDNVDGVGESFFEWGVPVDGSPTGGRSSLQYDDDGFSTDLDTPFKIGTLTYVNRTSELDSGADSVKLDLEIVFTLPDGISRSFLYQMLIDNTPNDGQNEVEAADSVILSSFPDKTFTFDDTTYFLSLAFENLSGGGFTQTGNQLLVKEGMQGTADLNGLITVVPEPSSVLAGGLLMLPFAGWLFRAAKQRTNRQ